MYSYSFGLLKPDCHQRGLTEFVMKMISENDLHFEVTKKLILSRSQVESIYFDSKKDWYFEDHVKFMMSGPVTAYVVGGEYAIQRLNELVGYTIPSLSASGTIRRFGTDICRNLIHSSCDYPHFLKDAKTIFYSHEFDYLYQKEYLS